MKRFILVLFGGLLLNAFAFAQADLTTQTGKATQEMRVGGLSAYHARIPLDSAVKVKNTETGKEVEVSVIGRIPNSPNRIIDLSYEAWEELDLTEDTIITISYAPPTFPYASTGSFDWDKMSVPGEGSGWLDESEQIEVFIEDDFFEEESFEDDYVESDAFDEVFIVEDFVEIEEEEFPVIVDAPVTVVEAPVVVPPPPPAEPVQTAWVNPSQTLYHLLVLDRRYCVNADIGNVSGISMMYKYRDGADGYIVALYASSPTGPVFPALPDKSRIIVDMVSARKATLKEYITSSAFRRFVINPMVLSQLANALEDGMAEYAVTDEKVISGVKIIPGLPNPQSGKIYRIQVGAFSVPESADRTMQQIRNAGLQAGQEVYGSLRRVLAVDVRAADVSAAVQALGAAGFKEVWIKE